MTITDLGVLILRLVVGLTFAAHGAQKAFGWWGGPGPERWQGAVRKMGFRPHGLFTFASIAVELVGGVALALGFLTSLAAALLVAQTIVIVGQVHLPSGFFNAHGGVEFPLVLGASALVAGLLTPGIVSLDGPLELIAPAWLRLVLILGGLAVGGLVLGVPRWAATAARPPLDRSS
jgi:putative oxidoreductase